MEIKNIEDIVSVWQDKSEIHKIIVEECTKNVNNVPYLKAHRDFVETNIFGFGERSFLWMWKLLIDKMPDNFTMLEIGVFRGQILSLVKLLANKSELKCYIDGITPLDSTDGHWESDYRADILRIHKEFNLEPPNIIKGLSTDKEVIDTVKNKLYNIVYIDGGHTYEVVKSDLVNYTPLVKKGGFLVIDDSCNNMNIPFGHFPGIESVTKAVEEYFSTDKKFKFLFNVMHNRVYQAMA